MFAKKVDRLAVAIFIVLIMIIVGGTAIGLWVKLGVAMGIF